MPDRRPTSRRRARWSVLVAVLLALLPTGAVADPPSAPFAVVQYGTNGCLEVGVRPAAPYNQPLPNVVPDGYDILSGYPAPGYDSAAFTPTSGTNACRYNFRDVAGTTIGSGYCVQWARGQRSGTGYDPEPWDGGIANQGYVQWIVEHYWPATDLPVVPATVAKTVNAQRSGTVAMALHYFTDGIVMPPNYQVPALYDVVRSIVDDALAHGPSAAPADPTPTIDGPAGVLEGVVAGPYTIGADALGALTVDVTGAQAFTDAAATVPFTGSVSAGGQLWLVPDAGVGRVEIHVSGPVASPTGTLMVGDPAFRVQSMMLALPLSLVGKSSASVTVAPSGAAPTVTSQISSATPVVEVGASVFDQVSVAGLVGGGTLTAVLYGPVPPVGAACTDADWATAPVATAFPAAPVTAELGTTTPSADLGPPGCYSFGLTLHPDTGADVVVPPGDLTETVLVVPHAVVPAYRLTSHASTNVATTGASVADTVTLSGLLTDRSMVLISALFGPVAPDAAGTCAGVDWAGLLDSGALPLVTAFPPTTLTGNGSYTTPAATVTGAGCYTFGATMTTDLLTGGEEPVVLSVGDPAEVVLVSAEPPAAGAELVDTGSDPAPLAGVALLLLLVGGGLVVLRRHATSS